MENIQVCVWFTHACMRCNDDMVNCVLAEIDVQLVGLIKTLIDPENIMTDAAAVVSHVTITWLSHDTFITWLLTVNFSKLWRSRCLWSTSTSIRCTDWWHRLWHRPLQSKSAKVIDNIMFGCHNYSRKNWWGIIVWGCFLHVILMTLYQTSNFKYPPISPSIRYVRTSVDEPKHYLFFCFLQIPLKMLFFCRTYWTFFRCVWRDTHTTYGITSSRRTCWQGYWYWWHHRMDI